MNRRRFFGFLAAAPVAIATMPTPASGGVAMGRAYPVGEGATETIVPLRKMETVALKFDEGHMVQALRRMQAHVDERIASIRADMLTHTAHDPDQTFLDGAGI